MMLSNVAVHRWEGVVDGSPDPSAGTPRPRVQFAGRTPLAGRTDELALIRDRIDAAAGGAGGVVLVSGEPGAGKSRLLDEAARAAAEVSARVLRGGASEAEGMPPYLPFLEALGAYIQGASPDILRRQSGSTGATLAGILPELAERLGELPPSYPLPPEQARLRLYQAVGAFLGAIAQDGPLLLLLDDLQWADAATLDLLLHVAAHQSESALLILGAYRDTELEANPALQRAIGELTRRRLLLPVRAARLKAAEIAALAVGYLDAEVEPALALTLHAQSEGNPFFAEELLRAWQESGRIVQANGRWLSTPASGPALPASIVETVRQRVRRLSPDVADLLRIGAIVGRSFDVELLATVVEQDAEAVEETLTEALRARLLQVNQTGQISFTHDKIRECLYSEVTAMRRTRLHGLIGRALEERGDESNRALADLAFHFARSQDRERGVLYSQHAAVAALRASAPEEAVQHYRAGLALVPSTDARRAALLYGLGNAALFAGTLPEATAAFAAAEKASVEQGEALAAARAAHGRGRALLRVEEHAAGQAALERALSLLQGYEGPEAVEVLTELAYLFGVSTGRQTEAMVYSQRAREMAERLGDARLRVQALRAEGNLTARNGDVHGGIRLLRQALALALEADDVQEAAETAGSLPPVLVWAGKMDDSLAASRQRMEIAQRCGDVYQLRHAASAMMIALKAKGRIAEAEAIQREGQAVVEILASAEPLAFMRYASGALHHSRGNYAEAEELVAQAVATFREMGSATAVWYAGLLGVIQLEAGKRREAAAVLEELDMLIAANPPGTMAVAHALLSQGLLAVGLDDHERATRCYADLAAFRGLHGYYLIDRVLGVLATYLGHLSAAGQHLDAAEAHARAEGLLPDLGRTMAARAELALARGGRGSALEAREFLRQALDIFEQIGMAGEVARTRARLRTLPTQPGPPRPALPAGLSEREANVLRLLAAGKSNREIASALALSEKTVANHITAIFTKTGCENRAAAAAYAIRQGLG